MSDARSGITPINELTGNISPKRKLAGRISSNNELSGEMNVGSVGVVDPDLVYQLIEEYLEENPPSSGVDFEPDATLKLENGILSVNTTDEMEADNTIPITSAGVYATVGNIEVLLKTI